VTHAEETCIRNELRLLCVKNTKIFFFRFWLLASAPKNSRLPEKYGFARIRGLEPPGLYAYVRVVQPFLTGGPRVQISN